MARWSVLLLSWLKAHDGILVRNVDLTPRWRAIYDLVFIKRLAGGLVRGLWDASLVLWQLVWFRPAVLHLATSGSLASVRDFVMLLLARVCRVRSVIHIHHGLVPAQKMAAGWEWRLLKFTLCWADCIMVLDMPTETALLCTRFRSKVVRVTNAVILKETEAPSKTKEALIGSGDFDRPGGFIVLYLGWVKPTKGMKELMEAWGMLSSQNWTLRIAGPGHEPYCRELRNLAGAGAKVQFLGDLPHAFAWDEMLKTDIFVLPSHTEAFPNVILEAMAAGKAIIATRVGAIPEILDADTAQPCGIVVEPQDSRALAEALRLLLEDPGLRGTLARRAKSKVERHYSPDAVLERYIAIWSGLADSRTGGRIGLVLSNNRLTDTACCAQSRPHTPISRVNYSLFRQKQD